jgi:hypothetical protein
VPVRLCNDCGFYRGKNHSEVCIAKQEERNKPGYQPNFREPKPRAADAAQENIQQSARRR